MKYLVLFIICLVTVSLSAHPHSFIDNSFDIYLDSTGIEHIGVKWVFDEMFTESILNDYDINQNRIFEEAERQKLYDEAFINTQNFNYFLDIKINSDNIEISDTENFRAACENEQLVYYFDVKLPEQYVTLGKDITIMCYDPTYYIMVDTAAKGGIVIHEKEAAEYQLSIIEKWVDFDLYGELPVNAAQLQISQP